MARTMISRSRSLALVLGLAAVAVPATAVAQTPAPAAAAPAPTDSSHTVKAGDTLWGLAQQYFGDPLLWPEIYRLNTGVVEDPHWIYPGEVLQLRSNGAVASVPATPADTSHPAAVVAPAVAAATPVAPPPATDTTQAAQAATPPADTTAPAAEAAAQVQDTTPPEPEDNTPLFPPTSGLRQPDVVQRTFEDNYRPLKRSDFYSSGFLSERQELPYGHVLGNTTPLQIHSTGYGAASAIYSRIALSPPKGGTYQVGDTLLLARVDRVDPKWGDIVFPVGLAKVVDVSHPQNQAIVIAQYGSIHEGTLTLLAEKFVDPGHVRAAPVANGLEGHLLFGREMQPLKLIQTVVFIDKGRADGVRQGDIFEVRPAPEGRTESPVEPASHVVARLKVVRVGEHSATARVIDVTTPSFAPGSPVRLIARLPG